MPVVGEAEGIELGQQLVEVTKALSQDFSVTIMDEPTAALNSAEVDRLFEIVAQPSIVTSARQGVAR